MSGDAGTWARAQPCCDRNAKQVLVHMAAYFDADGEGWAKVSLLALEIGTSERTVQRGIQRCLELGLLEATDRRKLYRGRWIPVYRMPLERGPSNTAARIAAMLDGVRDAAAGVGATGDKMSPGGAATGDTSVALTGDTADGLRVTPASPDYLKTQGNYQENTQTGARETSDPGDWQGAFETVWAAWAKATPDGVARPDDQAAWIAAVEAMGDPAGLERSILAYLARSPAVKAGRGKSMVRWLRESGWLAWPADAEAAGPPERPVFAGPAAVRAAFVAAKGADWVSSWLANCDWDPDGPKLVPRLGFTFQQLRRDASVRALLAELNITLAERTSA